MGEGKRAAARIVDRARQFPVVDGDPMSNHRTLVRAAGLAVELSQPLKSAKQHISNVIDGLKREFADAKIKVDVTTEPTRTSWRGQEFVSLGTLNFTARRHVDFPRADARWLSVRFLVENQSASTVNVCVCADTRSSAEGTLGLVRSIDVNSAAVTEEIDMATEEALSQLLDSLPIDN